MDNSRGTATHFMGIVRIIAFVVLIAIIAFFAIRWVRASQDTSRADQAAQTQGDGAPQEEAEESEGAEEARGQSEVTSDTAQEEDSIQDQPSQGIANTGVSAGEIPRVGMEDTWVVAAMVSGLVYATALYGMSRRRLKAYAGK